MRKWRPVFIKCLLLCFIIYEMKHIKSVRGKPYYSVLFMCVYMCVSRMLKLNEQMNMNMQQHEWHLFMIIIRQRFHKGQKNANQNQLCIETK